MTPGEMVSALRARWWMPVAFAILGGAVGLGLSLLQTPLYTSSSQLFVTTTDSASPADAWQGQQLAEQRANSYAQLLTGERLAARVVRRVGLTITPGQLTREIQATPVTNTVLIDVSVTDPSPQGAYQIANAVDSEFIAMVSELETSQATGRPVVGVTVSDPAQIPAAPSSPLKTRNVALGVLAGVLLGSAAAIARARFDPSVRSSNEARELVAAPVLGIVRRDRKLARRHLVDRTTQNRTAEDYRRLRAKLQLLDVPDPPRVIMVSSAMRAAGRTTTVVNLALVLAEAGRRVTIVEADLRHPKVSRYLQVGEGRGLTDVLSGNAALEDVIQAQSPNLSVIGSGPLPVSPGELLASGEITAVLDKLRSENDVVLVDAPPLLPVADSIALAVNVDGVLLSARYGSTRRGDLREAAAALESVGATTLGVVVHALPPRKAAAGAHGSAGRYGSTTARHTSERSPATDARRAR